MKFIGFIRRSIPFLFLVGQVMPQAVTQQQRRNPERTLLAHTLALEVEYLRLYEGMSMEQENGKGKGKGAGDGKVMGKGMGKGKEKSKGMPKGDDCPGKGKGKGDMMMCMNDSKKGGNMSKKITKYPSASVVPSRSPAPSVTFIPTSIVEPTAIPTIITPNISDSFVILSPYFIFYEIEQTRIPSISDYSELATFTENYLNSYFLSIFSDTETFFISSITNVTGSEFRLGEPVRVDYNTSVLIGSQSTVVPSLNELDAILTSAFEGTNGEAYAAAVANGVDPTNIFSTTSEISFEQASTDTSRNSNNRITIFAVVSTIAILTAALFAVLHRRVRSEHGEKISIGTENSSVEGISPEDDDFTVHSHYDSISKYRYNGVPSLRQAPGDLMKAELIIGGSIAAASDLRVASSKCKAHETD